MDKETHLEHDPKEKIAEAIKRLRWFKDEWSNEVPTEVIYGGQTDKKKQMFKVRKNWWGGLFTELEYGALAILNTEMHSSLIQEIRNFFHDYGGVEFQGKTGRLTTKEDIERANKLIEETILALENL